MAIRDDQRGVYTVFIGDVLYTAGPASRVSALRPAAAAALVEEEPNRQEESKRQENSELHVQ